MFNCFFPDEYLDSTYVINFDDLYAQGYRGLLFDIDNTLVPHGAPADERACALFAHLKELGFKCCFLSNNQCQRRQGVRSVHLLREHRVLRDVRHPARPR